MFWLVYLLIVLGLFLSGYNPALGAALFGAGLLIVSPAVGLRLGEWLRGIELPHAEFGRTVYLVKDGRLYRATGVLRIENITHNLFDLTPLQFLGRAVFYVDGLVANPNGIYDIVYCRERGVLKGYVRVSVWGQESSEIKDKLRKSLLAVQRHLNGLGVRAVLARGDELKLRLPVESIKLTRFRRYGDYLLVLVPAFVLATKLRYSPFAWVLAAAAVVALVFSRRVRGGYRLKWAVLSLSRNEAIHTNPSVVEYAQRARWVHSLLNVDLDEFILVIRLRVAPPELLDRIEKKAYRLYERATALDKLSMLAKSEKLYVVSERRWKNREQGYLASMVFLVPREHAETVKRNMESVGFRLTDFHVSKSAVLRDLY